MHNTEKYLDLNAIPDTVGTDQTIDHGKNQTRVNTNRDNDRNGGREHDRNTSRNGGREHDRNDGRDYDRSRSDRGGRDRNEDDKNDGSNLYIENLHPRTRECDLIPELEKFGTVSEVTVLIDPHTNQSRGFAFAKMSKKEEAEAVIRGLDGVQIDGKTIIVQKSKRSGPRPKTPGYFLGKKRGSSKTHAATYPYSRYDPYYYREYYRLSPPYDRRHGYRDPPRSYRDSSPRSYRDSPPRSYRDSPRSYRENPPREQTRRSYQDNSPRRHNDRDKYEYNKSNHD